MKQEKKPVYEDAFGNLHNSIFRPGRNFRLNACVGKNGGRAGFDRYARGYFEAGARLVKSLQDDPLEVDLVVYPLVMIYRHGAETALKHLGRVLPLVCDEPAAVKPNHKLLENWVIVRRCLEKLRENGAGLDQIEGLLKDLVQIDPNSTVFRYPEANDKARTPHLQDTSLINLEVFGEGMKVFADFFDGTCAWAD